MCAYHNSAIHANPSFNSRTLKWNSMWQTNKLIWSFSSFSTIKIPASNCIKSPIFEIGDNKWYARLYPCGSLKSSTHVGFYICPELPVLSEMFLTVTCYLVDSKGSRIHSWSSEACFTPRECKRFGTPTLYDIESLRERISDNKLDIEFEVAVCSKEHQFRLLKEREEKMTIRKYESKLIEDLSLGWASKEFADVDIDVNGTHVKAHSQILALRSPVFGAMFLHSMKENLCKVIVISDFDEKVIHRFLEFLYTGRLKDLDAENATELLKVADKYDVQDLKEMCADFLASSLNHDNFCEILLLADMHNDDCLKQKVLDFVYENRKSFTNEHSFSPVLHHNPGLMSELLIKALSRK